MKKQKTLAVLLSAAMVAGAIPTAALAEVVGSNSDSGVKAAELSEDQEIAEQNEDSEDETGPGYVLMNVPYDEVYGKDIANKTKVDAVSSATKKKTKKKTLVNGTYHSKDGSEIKGAIIPVRVEDLSLLGGFKRVSASNAEKVLSPRQVILPIMIICLMRKRTIHMLYFRTVIRRRFIRN